MARKVEKKRTLIEKGRLCVLAMFFPERFAVIEAADTAEINSTRPIDERNRLDLLRDAYRGALALVSIAAVVGLLLGAFARIVMGPAAEWLILALQVVAAGVILWATLALVGWPILSFSAVTLSELVNLWIYRFAYSFGTALLISSLVWSA